MFENLSTAIIQAIGFFGIFAFFVYQLISSPSKGKTLSKPYLKKPSSCKNQKASLKNIFKKKESEETEEIISKKKGWFSRRN